MCFSFYNHRVFLTTIKRRERRINRFDDTSCTIRAIRTMEETKSIFPNLYILLSTFLSLPFIEFFSHHFQFAFSPIFTSLATEKRALSSAKLQLENTVNGMREMAYKKNSLSMHSNRQNCSIKKYCQMKKARITKHLIICTS